MRKIKAIIIDDSALVRNIITDLLESDGSIEVIATGKTGLDCVQLVEKLRPDVVTLDVEMPVMDGLTALKELSQKNIKVGVIMLSVLTQHGAKATFQALELGAIDFVPKPSTAMKMDMEDIGKLLKSKILGYFESEHRIQPPRVKVKVGNFPSIKKVPVKAIGIGTSTGGPNALQILFKQFPENFQYPIFVVQHMPAGFTKAFAERLDEISKIKVKEAENGEIVRPGWAYIAPGNFHMKIQRKDMNISIELDQGSPVNGHRPSVDVTFDSLSECYGPALLPIIMTGMGRDGADSIKRLRDKGSTTIAQDEKTSVIFGMNRQAIDLGAIDHIVALEDIVPQMIRIIKERGM
ncbi:MAG: chemotaxis response regulator protein-glutamate methylesterase [Leptospiraceae bacterium]|nr:chemotaxis response regulator protein-glutamate methylesterase [Leptospiraceae bacterium]MCP5510519.1 chemotaxis response regulator protein-glutamate methylesterase [Leptospiraceae bacterium]